MYLCIYICHICVCVSLCLSCGDMRTSWIRLWHIYVCIYICHTYVCMYCCIDVCIHCYIYACIYICHIYVCIYICHIYVCIYCHSMRVYTSVISMRVYTSVSFWWHEDIMNTTLSYLYVYVHLYTYVCIDCHIYVCIYISLSCDDRMTSWKPLCHTYVCIYLCHIYVCIYMKTPPTWQVCLQSLPLKNLPIPCGSSTTATLAIRGHT